MSNLPQVQGLTLNQSSLLQSLRHAFAGKGSLVLELVQNARRAGATRVSVDYDEKNKTLIVTDDGHGIKDPNLLFAIGDSGWDEQVRETDKPFGFGLLSAVYQAQHMDIRSGTLRIQADTQALLEGGKPTVEQMAEPVQGTTIILNGVGYLPMDELPWRLAAFPIPVIIDGKDQVQIGQKDIATGGPAVPIETGVQCHRQGHLRLRHRPRSGLEMRWGCGQDQRFLSAQLEILGLGSHDTSDEVWS